MGNRLRKDVPSVEERFWSKVDRSGDCWLWIGAKDEEGYGFQKILGRMWHASRVSWKIAHGDIPDGLLVLHKCDNPPCIRPSHLFLGTQKENIADAMRKGRFSSEINTRWKNRHVSS
jgi:hypothetical protein